MGPDADASLVEFRLLGPVEVVVGGQRCHLGGARQDKLLAAFLLASDSLLTPENLIDVLWEDAPPSTARRQVHNAVSALRKRLGPARSLVVTTAAHYRVDVDREQVDIHRFARAYEAARAAASRGDRAEAMALLREALGRWRGPALAGLGGRAIEAAAARLEEQRLEARELLIDLRLACGDTDSLIPDLTELVAANPLRERFAHQLILALCHARRQPEALTVYQRTRARMAEELGVDPSRELRELHERILREDPGLDRPTPAQAPPAQPCVLPHDIADFTGRTAEVDHLVSAGDSADGTALVISAVDGMAGVGKTTLAIRVAHRLADRYPDGQIFADLHGYTPGEHPLDPAAALDLLLRSLGLPPERIPHDVDSKVAQWRSELAGRRALVVLDNAANTAQVRALLPGTPSARVIVTSRRRLSTLEGAVSLPLELMPAAEAVDLFRTIAGPDRVDNEADQVAAVVELCGRLPLAIRIAASRLRHRPTWTVRYLAGRLSDERRRLVELSTADRSVLAAFTVSYRHLTGPQRRLYRLLGLHPGPDFDNAAAAALVADDSDVDELMEDLLDVHLLSQHKRARYHFHDLIRRHAQAMAEQEESEQARRSAVERLVAHYIHRTEQAEKVVGGAKRFLAAEHRNLAAIAGSAVAFELSEQACSLPSTVGPVLLRNGYAADALTAYGHGLAAARAAGDRTAEADLLRNRGVAWLGVGRFDEARNSLCEALDIVGTLNDPDGEAATLRHIGTVHIRLGRYREAIDTLRRALAAISGSAPPFDRAAVLANLGVALTKTGRYREAADHHLRALDLVSGHNPYAEAMGRINLGWTYTLIGDLAAAREHLTSALGLTRGIGAKEAESRGLYLLADCLRRAGDTAEALTMGREALILARTIRDQDVQGQALNTLGQIHHELGDFDAAADCFRHALRLVEDSGQTYKAAQSYHGLGRIAAARGDRDAALADWERALDIATTADLPERVDIERDIAALGGCRPVE